ncbi:MAG: hypothetical protein OEZ68_12610 [Gammaproteobacteria bacterium]|nr:hypothetical protein [Gammaproteobacteria bacterium]MDH5801638.1 hypothetical protein [Gammaproteobacteria bacterium]
MSTIMAVLLNGVAQLEYHRDRELPDHQAVYLDKMDQKMDQGIDLDGESIVQPDTGQRAQFVAGNLAGAILANNETMATALCTYLAVRIPELKQVKIQTEDASVSVELIFDESYSRQVPVKFFH